MRVFSRFIWTTLVRMGEREGRIKHLIESELKPSVLEVLNESYMHNVPKGAETHFKVVVVSPEFTGISLVKRHQKVNGLLSEEFKSGLHALSIVAKTPEEWEKFNVVDASPKCLGGSKR